MKVRQPVGSEANHQMSAGEGLFVVIQVILVTMAAERIHISKCRFEDVWREMFSEKSLQIKTIEESVHFPTSLLFIYQLECCGFASVKDRVYPFPGKFSNATACVDSYGYTEPCLPRLQSTTRQIAIWLLLIVILTLIANVPISFMSSALTHQIFSFVMLMRDGLRKLGLGFLFPSPDEQPWDSETGERAPLLENYLNGNLEDQSAAAGESGSGAGNIVEPSID
jgi:hypothetical protein